ncbi:MAG TPA: ATP-grasp domain-containing protein [Pirellulales bacterium]|nr:ATP-grasp domain-containing protein [Pirellulales bacterium]
MPRVFVYEFTTGGGLLALNHEAPMTELLAEGRAMVAALTADFAAIGQLEVTFLADRRLIAWQGATGRTLVVGHRDEAKAAFDRLTAEADWTVVIAPETDGHLVGYCRRVVELGGRLLGPSPELVALASDKQATAEHLAAAGVRVPRGMAWPLGPLWPRDFPYPAIWKPRDGAGSRGLRYIACPEPSHTQRELHRSVTTDTRLRRMAPEGRLERYCPGLPASVAVLCGPKRWTTLPPCRQAISDDGHFRYQGGSFPLEPALAERATRLANEAVASLPQPLGYLGVDLILGPDGDADFVIEINPRLTTSYIGLRAACEGNLAEAMLAIAQGQAPAVHFRNEPVRFSAEGMVVCNGPLQG